MTDTEKLQPLIDQIIEVKPPIQQADELTTSSEQLVEYLHPEAEIKGSAFDMTTQDEIAAHYYHHGPASGLFDLLNPTQSALTPQDRAANITGIAKLIRGVCNWRVTEPSDDADKIYLELIDIAFDIYAEKGGITDEIDAKLKKLREYTDTNLQEFMQFNIGQKSDTATTLSIEREEQAVKRVKELAEGQNVILITFAGGGVLSGLDVMSRSSEFLGDKSIFYPVRYSRSAAKGFADRIPQISDAEVQRLKKFMKDNNAKLIVYDEDIASGTTTSTGAWYMKQLLDTNRVNIVGSIVNTRDRSQPRPASPYKYIDVQFPKELLDQAEQAQGPAMQHQALIDNVLNYCVRGMPAIQRRQGIFKSLVNRLIKPETDFSEIGNILNTAYSVVSSDLPDFSIGNIKTLDEARDFLDFLTESIKTQPYDSTLMHLEMIANAPVLLKPQIAGTLNEPISEIDLSGSLPVQEEVLKK